MLPISDPLFYLYAIPAVLIVGLSKGGFGGGIALIGVPLMSLAVSPIKAAGIMLPILLVMDAVGLLSYRHSFNKPVLFLMIPAGCVGITIGWATAAYVTADHVRLIVGVVSLAFVLNHWLGSASLDGKSKENKLLGGFWGMVAGFTSFVSHSGGPPYQMYTLKLGMQPVLYAGTSVVFFAAINAVKVIPYFFLGQFDTTNLATSAALMPLAPLATYAGVRIVRVIDQTLFYRITYIGVFFVALKLIWDGLVGLGYF
ncbi:sulfite exporter TauE/SafE family protein [Pseudovibrio sp. SPO723]|uniref:sulfite exporter TauE/SafE family protein n=1 Tax=Nesiotobacter zosterae TaxID=392721 RepID=UPI0029C20E59|nr:sulfite exporter TauE/SafE family protein [Pseudovibrio sp. SPO723]MDX5595449.1 sulfite exporter TauE/SafE family protein [Pseudovibrio sp. SPO723]